MKSLRITTWEKSAQQWRHSMAKNINYIYGASWVAQRSSACNAGELGLIPGSGRCPEGRYGNPLQYSCLENSMDKGAYWSAVHGVTKSQIQLSNQTTTDAGKDWRREKWATEYEMAGWHHRLNGNEFEQTLGDLEGQGSLMCCSPWGHKESDTTEWTTITTGGSDSKESTCSVEDPGSIPGSGRSPG